MVGTTDKGNVEDELFLVFWCDADENIHTHMSYFTEDSPQDSTAVGLLKSL